MTKDLNIQYVICPDKECKGFWEESDFPCDGNCPKDCKFFIYCGACREKIVFDPKVVTTLMRIDCTHAHPKYGNCGGCNFTRMSGHWEITYETH